MFEQIGKKILVTQQVRRTALSDDDIWLAGLGALVVTELENNRLFESLVKEGRAIDQSLSTGGQAALELAERTPCATEKLLRIAEYQHLTSR